VAILFRVGRKKICRIHKNQAVNLLQILIHAPNAGFFIPVYAVNFPESRVPGQFQGKRGYL
jgi:hypothetical protein